MPRRPGPAGDRRPSYTPVPGGAKGRMPLMPRRRRPLLAAVALFVLAAGAPLAARAAEPASKAVTHLFYLHGRIVQEQQSARPKHEQHGFYEYDAILDTLRKRGFEVHSGIRPKAATVSESADRVVREVRGLLGSGVPAERIVVVGASMGASITFLASVRLQNPELRFAVLGACLSENVRALTAEEGRSPSGEFLSIREASDDTGGPCPSWTDDMERQDTLRGREIVLQNGLGHGFIYRPLPEWVDPLVAWASRSEPEREEK